MGLNVPAGWYPASVLLGAIGYEYNGVISDISEDPIDGTFRFLLERVVYQYKDRWVSMKAIGWAGTGLISERFNHPSNEASGEASHAEGFHTIASGGISHAEGVHTKATGDQSHAEGAYTTASGDYSHAEGAYTTASGDYSHAEGLFTTASGNSSHAEGVHTKATGDQSHAEGLFTTASGNQQHVQGKYNIDDAVNKYAHIVGNGSYDAPSNAHTLDWDGNAWFQGNVFVGGTSQDDPAAKRLLTEDDIPEGDGSSGETWETIVDVTITEEVTVMKITEDINGNPFSLVEAEIDIYIMGTESNAGDAALSIRTNMNTAAKGGTNSLATRMFRTSGGPYKLGMHLTCHSENIRGTIHNIGNGQNNAASYWNPNFSRFESLYLYGGIFGVGSRVLIRGIRA